MAQDLGVKDQAALEIKANDAIDEIKEILADLPFSVQLQVLMAGLSTRLAELYGDSDACEGARMMACEMFEDTAAAFFDRAYEAVASHDVADELAAGLTIRQPDDIMTDVMANATISPDEQVWLQRYVDHMKSDHPEIWKKAMKASQ